MTTIAKSSLIDCELEELFEFHLDSNNLKKITPTNTKIEILNEDTKTFEGKIVNLKVTEYFISMLWKVKIEKLQKPNLIVDLALESPLKYFRHQHIFTKVGNRCELKDVIEYELNFIGKLINPIIKKDILKVFDYRHERTKEILENKSL